MTLWRRGAILSHCRNNTMFSTEPSKVLTRTDPPIAEAGPYWEDATPNTCGSKSRSQQSTRTRRSMLMEQTHPDVNSQSGSYPTNHLPPHNMELLSGIIAALTSRYMNTGAGSRKEPRTSYWLTEQSHDQMDQPVHRLDGPPEGLQLNATQMETGMIETYAEHKGPSVWRPTQSQLSQLLFFRVLNLLRPVVLKSGHGYWF